MPEFVISKPVPKGVTRRDIYLRTFAIIAIIVLISTGISAYFLIYQPHQNSLQTQSKISPTPTPIPEYISFLQRPADYVGIVERIDSATDLVTVLRDDGSRIQLTLNAFTQIYLVARYQPQTIQVTISTISALQEQMTISIYTNEKSIQAVFALESDITVTPTAIPTVPILSE